MSKLDTLTFKLDEINRKIDTFRPNYNYIIKQSVTWPENPHFSNSTDSRLRSLRQFLKQRIAITHEIEKEMQFLADQELLQQQVLTEQAEAKAEQERERIRLLQEQVNAAHNISEQEKQKIEQELQKARVELQKAKLAAKLAQQGGDGNIAAGKTLMGTWEEKKGVNPYMIAGITVGALTIGGIIYKIIK